MAEAVNGSSFSGRVALVTGAGRGLGRAYAAWLAARGAKVVVNNRVHAGQPSAAQAAAEAIRAAGGEAVADEHSVETEAGSAAMVRTALEHYGRLDILICNAAVGADGASLQQTPLETLHRIIEINLWGSLYPVRAALDAMTAQDYGRIVLTTSAAGLYGARNSVAYATSKAAMTGLARSVCMDNKGRDILANVVSPYARTEMASGIDPKFATLMDPARVAPVVGFLASQACTRGGMILAAGSGRVRRVATLEGPLARVPEDITEPWPELDTLAGAYEPTSMTNSSLSLTPEIVGQPAPI